jgi:uncharacterized protein YjiS (DUF1127 family)
MAAAVFQMFQPARAKRDGATIETRRERQGYRRETGLRESRAIANPKGDIEMIRTLLHRIRESGQARRRRQELRELGSLDPRLLRDIGVTEGEINDAMRRLKYWI